MSEQVIHINTTFQVRRGESEAWKRVDPTLEDGEPGFELDTGLLKIGSGGKPYSELDYINGVYNAQTRYGFPSIGQTGTIYKAESEKALYQWNPDTEMYEQLQEATMPQITLINGGNATDEY